MNCDLTGQAFKIIAVSNRKLCERPFAEQIERVCQIKPEAIILREKICQKRNIEFWLKG